MTPADLAFLLTGLYALVSCIRIVIALARRRRAAAVDILRRLTMVLAVYLAIVAVVGLASPQRILQPGQELCSDEWCISATSVTPAPDALPAHGDQVSYLARLTLASHSRGRPQRERNVSVYLASDDAVRFAPVAQATDVPLDTLLSPGGTLTASRRFSVPRTARIAGLVIVREGAGRFPRCCIVGDNDSFLHRPALLTLR